MIKNPIVVGGKKLPALTNPGTAADLLDGKQLIDQYGNPLTGTIPTKAATDLIIDGATITVPAGYYAADASKSVATATQATPAISVSSAGLITASATQAAGYVAAGTKSATKQLTTKAAATITPGTANQSIAAGTYLTGAQTIKGDANLLAANIKSGVSIFGVAGSLASVSIIQEHCSDTIIIDTSADTITITLSQSCSQLLGVNVCLSASSSKKVVQIVWPNSVSINAKAELMYAGSTSLSSLYLSTTIAGNSITWDYSGIASTIVSAIIEAADGFDASIIYTT